MNKRFFIIAILLTGIFASQQLVAQNNAPAPKTFKVAIFSPLFLDSVFSTSGNFRYKENFPKFITPGLDFVQGAEIALDSLELGEHNVEASIYDTKSYTVSVAQLISSKKLDSVDLIIGSVKDFEFKQLADFAQQKNVPFISATLPNDGGITANPNLVIVNSTLKAHCEAIYSYLLQNHGTDKIFLCRKKGAQEDKVAAYFKAINEQDGKPLLSIQTLNFDSSINSRLLIPKLDSNRQTVIIGGSLEEGFANSITKACYDLREKYPIYLFGMPNWDGFKSLLKKDEYDDFAIYFTTPFYNAKFDNYSKLLMNEYLRRFKGKPTDMAFKGFECAYLFTNLMTKYPGDVINHLNDKSAKVFTEYNFRPVLLKKGNKVPDYYENKHLYFMKIINGTILRAW